MSATTHQEAIDLLQELGLKEYEARSFVVLARMEKATAKEIAEHSDVPRTRVYDAIRVLETRGLVGVQHTSPQEFRAVAIEEAVDTLDRQYDAKMDRLRQALDGLAALERDEDHDTHEVWSLADSDAIAARTEHLLDDAEAEVVLVLGTEQLFTDDLVEHLQERGEEGVDIIVGALTERLQHRVQTELPDARVFVTGLEWLRNESEDLEIGRLLLVDNENILVSTFVEENGKMKEHAVFGRGFTNGLVVVARRIMAIGLEDTEDPGVQPDATGEQGDATAERVTESDGAHEP